jgi:hypothetical protein
LWWFPVALVGLTLASGCRSTDEAAASEAWGDEALTYLQELSSAYAADDSYAVLDFYAPGAEVEMWRAGSRGGRVVDVLLIGPGLNRELLDVHLGIDVALAFIRWPESGKSSVVQSEFDNGSIVRDTVFDDVVSLAAGQRATPEVIGRYDDLYGEFAEAWSSGNTDRVAALYAPEARMRGPLSSVETAGREAIANLALDPPERWTRLPIDAIADDDGDLAAGFALYLGPTEYGHDPQLAVGAYRVERSDCSFQMAVRWVLADGVIVDERRYPEIESFRRCAVGVLPRGWWSDLTLPGPRDEVVTGTIRTAAQRIAVHNGTERLVGFVRWALERFDAAGLAEPRIGSVTFEPSRRCEDVAGRLILEDGSRDVFLCLHERDLCLGQPTCDPPALNVRIGILHELSHAWLLDHTDAAARTRLLDLAGLAAWDDGTAPWPQRGAEYAAEVLAWGLVDERAPMVRIGAPPCSVLQAAFELLTGAAPLIDRTECRP